MLARMRNAVWALIVLVAAGGAQADDGPAPMTIEGAMTVNAEQVITLFNEEPRLTIVDSRKPSDYASGHIETAVNLPNTETNAQTLAEILAGKDSPVLFYCNGIHCGRAADAVRKARDAGYNRIYYYALGMAEWEEKGLPVVAE